MLKVEDRATVIAGDLFHWMAEASRRDTASLVFLDPPYRFLRERSADLQTLAANLVARHLSPGGTIVFRHDAADALDLPPLIRSDIREYGGMTVEFLALAPTPTSETPG
jgi:16S rRNA G966 N2-methylase RsmD